MTLHIWLDAYKNELKKLGYNLSNEIIIADFFYEHSKTTIKYPEIDFENFISKIRAYMISHISHMALYEGVIPTLQKLKENNITLTLVSSSPRKLLEEVLKLNKLDGFFSTVSGFDDIMKHKPDQIGRAHV